MSPCSAYNPAGICKNGFPAQYPASSACTGHVCMCCKKPNDRLPPCQNEDIASMWLNEDGSPKHANNTVQAAKEMK